MLRSIGGSHNKRNFPGGMRPESGGLLGKIVIASHVFCSREPERDTFAALIAGREALALPHQYFMGHSVLVVKYSIQAGLRYLLPHMERLFPRHTLNPRLFSGYRKQERLDVLEWSHRCPDVAHLQQTDACLGPGKWRISSGFRIIMVSRNML